MALQKFIIERDILKVGTFEREQLRQAAANRTMCCASSAPTSNGSKVMYLAKDEAIIRRHAEISGFPASKVTAVKTMIDPTTAAT
jgi:hypothetical protein